jgi:citrate lyase subunit beta/citryl-CoA lyase
MGARDFSVGERVMEMAMQEDIFSARSWLFAPGDSEKKMEKATAGPADIVIFDLEDAVADAEKPRARGLIADFLRAHARRPRSAVGQGQPAGRSAHAGGPCGDHAGPSRGHHAAQGARPRRCRAARPLSLGAGSRQRDRAGLDPGDRAGDGNGRGHVHHRQLQAGAPRVVALSWGAEDLADSIGASCNRNADGSYSFTYELARSLCLLGAAAAGVAAIETIQGDFRDLDGLRQRAEKVRRDGYRGMLAIHPAQVEVINAAFTPAEEELAAAQEIVDLFAANPGVGTIGHKGAMLDRPHLARARLLLGRRDADDGPHRRRGAGPRALPAPWRPYRHGPGLR